VQQYDKLKEDIEELDIQRQQLEAQVSVLEAQITTLEDRNKVLRENNAVILDYIDLLNRLVSTQNSEKILYGQFDTDALIKAKEMLIEEAETLPDSENIVYFLQLMNSENQSHTVGAYYKVVEYSVKAIKQRLEK
jgi:glycerol-3-phosphate responsive antiterminator